MLHGKDDRFGFPPTQIVEKHHGWNMGYGFLNDPRRFPDHRDAGVVLPYYDHLMVNGFRYNKVAVERSENIEPPKGAKIDQGRTVRDNFHCSATSRLIV